MKIVICCNHSFPHVGGSEKVVQQIAESSVAFDHNVYVISRSLTKDLVNNNVKYVKCANSGIDFIKQLKKLNPDHIHVYSDCFLYWNDIIHANIDATKSIALVGMNHMRESRRTMQAFLRNKDEFTVITHSDNYVDYNKCLAKGVSPVVIPNGVDIEEFDHNTTEFNKKGKKTVLCVSNFFPGKGQDHLVKILDLLANKRDDFRAVFVSTSINFAFARILERQVKNLLQNSKFEYDFLQNISREQTVAAFKHADVFAFPSQKEVAPLVLIESQAARVPWVSLPVGNARELKGGVIVPHAGIDSRGYARYSNDCYDNYTKNLDDMLNGLNVDGLVSEGREQVEKIYSWSKIGSLYNKVFIS